MSDLLRALTAVALTWVVLFWVFVGLGLLVRRPADIAVRDFRGLLTTFWVGWCLLVGVLPLWHLAFAVDGRVSALAAAFGFVGLYRSRTELRELFKRSVRYRRGFGLVIGLSTVAIAYRAIGPVLVFDTGVYHLSSVRWAAAYPAVPGLGNLMRYLAYNSSHFLYAAALDVGPWTHRSQHLANGLLIWVLWLRVLVGLRAVFIRGARARPVDLLAVLLAPFIAREAIGSFVASVSPDLPVFVIGVLLSLELLGFLSDGPQSARERDATVVGIVALALIGVAIKVSFLTFGTIAVLCAVIGALTDRHGSVGAWSVTARRAALVASLLLVPWVVHGVVLSGYPFYPSTGGAVTVDWRIPHERVVDMQWFVLAWAREPGFAEPRAATRAQSQAVVRTRRWIKPWLARMVAHHKERVVLPLALAAPAVLVAAVCSRRARWRRAANGDGCRWLVLLPPMIALLVWFWTLPDPRYAGASFALLAPASVAATYGALRLDIRRHVMHGSTAVAAAVLLYIIARTWQWFPAGTDGGFHPLRRDPLAQVVTDSGLTLWVPQGINARCWDAPLPCTHWPDRALRLRRDGDLGSGFRTAAELVQ